MDAEFFEKLLQAKRLEAEALALLIPYSARQGAARAIRICSAAALSVLTAPQSSANSVPSAAKRTQASAADGPLSHSSSMQPIVIE